MPHDTYVLALEPMDEVAKRVSAALGLPLHAQMSPLTGRWYSSTDLQQRILEIRAAAARKVSLQDDPNAPSATLTSDDSDFGPPTSLTLDLVATEAWLDAAAKRLEGQVTVVSRKRS